MVRRLRTALVLMHLATGFGWLSATAGVLLLAVNGERSAALRVDDLLLADLSFMTVYTGTMLAGLNGWGLARHRWVLVKLGAGIGAALGGRVVLPPLLAEPGTDPQLIGVGTIGALTIAGLAWLGRTKPGGRRNGDDPPPAPHPAWYLVALLTPALDYVTGLPWQAVPVAAVLIRNARR
jgi:hypothetical protein